MTKEMQDALGRELSDAKAVEDLPRRHDAIEMVQSHMLAALLDCQRKTADRVKDLVFRADSAKAKVQGAKMMWAIIRYLVAAGAGGALLKVAGV